LIENHIEHPRRHTDSWGVSVWTGEFGGTEVFVASVPMGAGGSGFAFHELFSAGALAIIRFGSNDRRVTAERLRVLSIVEWADNLYGLMRDSGFSETELGTRVVASPELKASVLHTANDFGCKAELAGCHHVEDYHAWNYPHLVKDTGAAIQQRIDLLEDRENALPHVWDMETAALYLRAQQFGRHALTILQSLMKHPGITTPYAGKHGHVALEIELAFGEIALTSLLRFLTGIVVEQN